jgi:hypothetical protein
MLRVSSHHGDEGEEKQREDQDDLATGEPKFSFTVGFDCQNIEETDKKRLAWSTWNADLPVKDGLVDSTWVDGMQISRRDESIPGPPRCLGLGIIERGVVGFLTHNTR